MAPEEEAFQRGFLAGHSEGFRAGWDKAIELFEVEDADDAPEPETIPMKDRQVELPPVSIPNAPGSQPWVNPVQPGLPGVWPQDRTWPSPRWDEMIVKD